MAERRDGQLRIGVLSPLVAGSYMSAVLSGDRRHGRRRRWPVGRDPDPRPEPGWTSTPACPSTPSGRPGTRWPASSWWSTRWTARTSRRCGTPASPWCWSARRWRASPARWCGRTTAAGSPGRGATWSSTATAASPSSGSPFQADTRERLDAYREALAAHGIISDDSLVFETARQPGGHGRGGGEGDARRGHAVHRRHRRDRLQRAGGHEGARRGGTGPPRRPGDRGLRRRGGRVIGPSHPLERAPELQRHRPPRRRACSSTWSGDRRWPPDVISCPPRSCPASPAAARPAPRWTSLGEPDPPCFPPPGIGSASGSSGS